MFRVLRLCNRPRLVVGTPRHLRFELLHLRDEVALPGLCRPLLGLGAGVCLVQLPLPGLQRVLEGPQLREGQRVVVGGLLGGTAGFRQQPA